MTGGLVSDGLGSGSKVFGGCVDGVEVYGSNKLRRDLRGGGQMNDDRYNLDDFELYQLARQFRISVYNLSKRLPADERYNLTIQLRRAALSVSNNIAEGHGRWFYLDNARFCRIARGSISEIIDDLHTCIDEQYASKIEIEPLKIEAILLIRRINGYINYLKKSQQGLQQKPPKQ